MRPSYEVTSENLVNCGQSIKTKGQLFDLNGGAQMSSKQGWVETRHCEECGRQFPHQMCYGTSYAGGEEKLYAKCMHCGHEVVV